VRASRRLSPRQIYTTTNRESGEERPRQRDLARRSEHDGGGPADHVVAEIRAAGGTAAAQHGAVEDPAAAESMVELALSEWGR
jgi:hypothetical protein